MRVDARRKRRHEAFTIIELAIVLTITAILATMAVYTYRNLANKARFTQAKIVLKHLQKVETLYFTDHDRYTDNVVLVDLDPIQYDYYAVSVTLLDNGLSYLGYARGINTMDGDLWTITPGGDPVQDNAARARF